MPRLGKPIVPESSILRGLVFNSKDLFSKEAYEERIDLELAMLMRKYPPGKLVDRKGAKEIGKVVNEFVSGNGSVRGIADMLRELDDIKLKAEQEEILKIDGIRDLLRIESQGVYPKDFKNELKKFSKSIKGNTIAALKSNLRSGKRLRRGHAPLGYVMKKLKNDRYLDAEVAKKAYELGKHAAEEHRIFYRVQDLIKMLAREPDNEVRKPLKSQIEKLSQDYIKDVGDFLNIEIDIKIEEARRLHRIDHYLTFLKSHRYSSNANRRKTIDPLINELTRLKGWAAKWVYQDTINAKKLQQYAIRSLDYGQKLLETSKIEPGQIFPGIKTEKHVILGEIPGLLIYDGRKPKPNRGLVLVHGAFATKESLLTLAKRMASQDFVVFLMDIAQHGENKNIFRLGLISEQILIAVSFLRSNGIRNVGVVGHSLGAMCTLFALTGYNSRIENRFFEATAALMKEIEKIAKDMDKLKKRREEYKSYFFERGQYRLIRLNKWYGELKQIILDGLKEVYASQSRIDAAVMLAPPTTGQFFLPNPVSGVIKRVPRKFKKIFTKGISNTLFFKHIEKSGENSNVPGFLFKERDDPQKLKIVGLEATDLYDTFDYVQKMNNPSDYMEAIKMVLEKVHSPDKRINFMEYYVNFIKKTPKLYIYGLGDTDILKSYIPRLISEFAFPVGKFQIDKLEAHYKDFGGEIVRIPDLNHGLTREGYIKVFDVARMPKITKKIVMFLNKSLGRGRLV
jgi:esterase/lipase